MNSSSNSIDDLAALKGEEFAELLRRRRQDLRARRVWQQQKDAQRDALDFRRRQATCSLVPPMRLLVCNQLRTQIPDELPLVTDGQLLLGDRPERDSAQEHQGFTVALKMRRADRNSAPLTQRLVFRLHTDIDEAGRVSSSWTVAVGNSQFDLPDDVDELREQMVPVFREMVLEALERGFECGALQ